MIPDEPEDEAVKWKLRERGQALGLLLFIAATTAVLKFRPDLARELIGMDPLVYTGGMFLGIGIFGGVAHSFVVLAHGWTGASDPELTEWDGD